MLQVNFKKYVQSNYNSKDAIKLRFILYTLKDNTKKWLYSMPTNYITFWDEFITVFKDLLAQYPHHTI